METIFGEKKGSKFSGFTLIELLVSINILAILMAIVLFSVNPSRQFMQAQDTRRKAEINYIQKALVQYFIDNRCLPTSVEWNNLICNGNIPNNLKPYLSSLPCDPETNNKYFYQPLDKDCQPCNGGCGVCIGFRIMASLKNKEDSSIKTIGCDKDMGCGIVNPQGEILNYGESFTCPVKPPISIITPSLSVTSSPTLSPSFTLSPSPTSIIPNLGCTTYELDSFWGERTSPSLPTYPDGWFVPGSSNGKFNYPFGINVSPFGNMVVGDSSNHRIQFLDLSGNYISSFGTNGTGNGQFHMIKGVSTDYSGNVYVIDGDYSWNTYFRVEKFDSFGNFITSWGQAGNTIGKFMGSEYVTTDSIANVYVSDPGNSRIQKFDSDGNYILSWGSFGSGNGQFKNPSGMTIGPNGLVYIADSGNHRIQIFDSSGNFISTFGSKCETGHYMQYGNCFGNFFYPADIRVDSSLNIYVLDRENNRVQKFDSNKNFITSLGSYAETEGAIGKFRSPSSMNLDSSGYIYVADYNRHNIQKFRCAN